MKRSNLQIHGTTPAIAGFTVIRPAVAPHFSTTLGAVTVAAGVVSFIGLLAGINGALDNGLRRLHLSLWHGFRNRILGGSDRNRYRGEGRNLHSKPRTELTKNSILLREYNEEVLNHLVANNSKDDGPTKSGSYAFPFRPEVEFVAS